MHTLMFARRPIRRCLVSDGTSSIPGGASAYRLYNTDPISERRYFSLKAMKPAIPNILSISRAVSSPFMGYLVINKHFGSSLVLFTFSSISDWLDGFLARRYNAKTHIGSIIDPLADKILVGTVAFSLYWIQVFPLPLFVIISMRDLILIIMTFVYKNQYLRTSSGLSGFRNIEIRPSVMGKLNTLIQSVLLFITLISSKIKAEHGIIIHSLQYTVGFTTILSGIGYAFSNKSFNIVR